LKQPGLEEGPNVGDQESGTPEKEGSLYPDSVPLTQGSEQYHHEDDGKKRVGDLADKWLDTH
jgi:hypothetical protein